MIQLIVFVKKTIDSRCYYNSTGVLSLLSIDYGTYSFENRPDISKHCMLLSELSVFTIIYYIVKINKIVVRWCW